MLVQDHLANRIHDLTCCDTSRLGGRDPDALVKYADVIPDGVAWLGTFGLQQLLDGSLGSRVKSPAGIKSARRRGAGVCPSGHTLVTVASLIIGALLTPSF